MRRLRLGRVLVFLVCAGCARNVERPALTGPLHLYSRNEAGRLPVDPNGFLLNPRWYGLYENEVPNIDQRCRFRAETGHLERRSLVVTRGGCLSTDEYSLVSLSESLPTLALGTVCVTGSKTGAIRGHVNWFPVTVTGQLRYNSFSAGAGDYDVNIDLIPADNAAVTTGNAEVPDYGRHRAFHTESYLEETLDSLNPNIEGFWGALKKVYRDKKDARQLVNDRLAIVTGLYGVDGVHGFQAELHPVYAMSVLVDTTSRSGIREQWAVMVRNTGSEGDCGEGTIPMLSVARDTIQQDFTIDFGPTIGSTHPRVVLRRPASSSSTEVLPTVSFARTDAEGPEHLYVTFRHPRPRPGEPGYLFFGTVYVEWNSADGGAWRGRFAGLTPTSSPGIKLSHIADRITPPMESGLESTTPPTPANTARVYNATPWPLPTRARSADCGDAEKGERYCFGTTRLVVGGMPRPPDVYPLLSYYRFPHSKYSDEDGFLAGFWNLFWTVGHRVDLRAERFDRRAAPPGSIKSRCANGMYSEQLAAPCGMSLRWNPFVSPSTIRLAEGFSFTPFTVGNVGLSWLDGAGFQGTSGWGIGVQFQPWGQDIFVETQRMKRWDTQFDSRWVWTIGWLTPFARSR